MVTKVQKWGNSLGVRLPKFAVEEARVHDGSSVDVCVRDGEIVVQPLKKARFHLRRMLAGIRPGNLHDELFVDAPRGWESL